MDAAPIGREQQQTVPGQVRQTSDDPEARERQEQMRVA